jgi:DNA-binding NarL/FixJ family response regulator
MGAVTVRVFSSHPIAAEQYTRVLTADKELRLASEEDPFQVGVFDGEAASIESVLTMIRLKFPSMRPLVLSLPCDENHCVRWLFRGVWGLVTYDRYEEELPRAVRHLAEGQLWFPPPVIVRWMRLDETRRASALHVSLTQRERDVMEFLLRRLSNKEIAGILRIKESTVKFHVGNIFNKLHVTSRHELSAEWFPYLALTQLNPSRRPPLPVPFPIPQGS